MNEYDNIIETIKQNNILLINTLKMSLLNKKDKINEWYINRQFDIYIEKHCQLYNNDIKIINQNYLCNYLEKITYFLLKTYIFIEKIKLEYFINNYNKYIAYLNYLHTSLINFNILCQNTNIYDKKYTININLFIENIIKVCVDVVNIININNKKIFQVNMIDTLEFNKIIDENLNKNIKRNICNNEANKNVFMYYDNNNNDINIKIMDNVYMFKNIIDNSFDFFLSNYINEYNILSKYKKNNFNKDLNKINQYDTLLL